MLSLGFFAIALLYSAVGFGGGSSYLALLAITQIPYEIIPKISLICNLLVVTGGCWHYARSGHFNKQLIFPFILSSVPMALIGGIYPISEQAFILLLAISLVLAALRIIFIPKIEVDNVKRPTTFVAIIIGAILGLLSGLVGLGGGIFLAPIMLNFKWGRPKEIAATASAFIFLNSLAGLSGQFIKGLPSDLLIYWPLFIAVILGGQIGSLVSNHQKISHTMVLRGTGLLILIISSRLIYKIFA